MEIEERSDLFEHNLRLWEHASAIGVDTTSQWEFCRTGKKKQLNLKHGETDQYLYSTRNIEVEVRQWTAVATFQSSDWMLIYGIGLGYYYMNLKAWLQENNHRRVIFIEDDPGVLRAFLKTSIATTFFQDPQTELIFEDAFDVGSTEFKKLIERALFRRIYVSALLSYQVSKKEKFNRLRFYFEFLQEMRQGSTAEYLLNRTLLFSKLLS